VDTTGAWTIAIPDTLANGTHSIRVVQRDNAGNESTPVTTSITIDTNMVNGLSLTSPAPGGYLQTASLSGIQFRGTCATGSVVYMESPINATGACSLTNTWSITGNLSTLPNGTVYVTIRQKDIGDSFTPLQPYYFTKDTNPAILSFSSSVMPGGGSINPIFVTLTTSETLTGLTAANIEVTSGSTLSGFTKVSGTNNYTFSLRPNDEYFGRVAFNVLTG